MSGRFDMKIIPELDGTSKSVAAWTERAELVCCVSEPDVSCVDVLHAVDV